MSPLSSFIQSNQIKSWNAVQTDPQFAFLKATASNVGELIQIVDRMGWQSLGEAVEALETLNAIVPFVAEDPAEQILSFDRDDLPSVRYSSLLGSFQLETGTNRGEVNYQWGGNFEFTDLIYGQLTKAQIDEIASKLKSPTMQYVDQTADCDDFAFAAKGELASQGMGNIAIGVALLDLYTDGVKVAEHANLIAIDNTGNAWWVEPQTGGVHDIQEIYLVGYDRVVITDWLV